MPPINCLSLNKLLPESNYYRTPHGVTTYRPTAYRANQAEHRTTPFSLASPYTRKYTSTFCNNSNIVFT